MSWVNDLASGLGIPAGAATLAVAVYAACAAAERAARPDALKDIGSILKDPSWEYSVQPSAIIERVFNWTFGERHLSWKCVRRSAAATTVFAILGVCFFNAAMTDTLAAYRKMNDSAWTTVLGASIGALSTFCFFGLLPDYLALWKTRYLVSMLHQRKLGLIITPVLDLILSFAVGYLCAVMPWAVYNIALAATGTYLTVSDAGFSLTFDPHLSFINLLQRSNSFGNWAGILFLGVQGMIAVPEGHVVSIRGLLLVSTLFTSIWTVLILLSTTVLKLLAPADRFTAWFFDVETHPVQAIGIVSGAFVMLGSLIWTVLRAVI